MRAASVCHSDGEATKISVQFHGAPVHSTFPMRQPTSDLRIRTARPLLSPAILEEDLPLNEAGAGLVQRARREIGDILAGTRVLQQRVLERVHLAHLAGTQPHRDVLAIGSACELGLVGRFGRHAFDESA